MNASPASRVYLGWDRPALVAAAHWLRERYANERSWDLSSVIIVTPGARAGRRLLEILVDHAGPHLLVPPRIVTAGQLPELLYTPPTTTASDLQSHLAWLHTIRSCEDHVLAALVPHPPPPDDLLAQLALADELRGIHETLAADAVTIDDVAAHVSADQQQRWVAIASLHDRYAASLAAINLIDLHHARRDAIAQGSCNTDSDIVLLAVADIARTLGLMLQSVAHRVTALIHAPQDEAEHFDELGGITVDAWQQRTIDLHDNQIRVVDRPQDQAHEVLRLIDSAARTDATLTPNQITLGLGDDALAPTVRRTLDAAGLPTRTAFMRMVTQSRPALLLGAMARYMHSKRFDDFAALLRHPDIDAWLTATLDPDDAAAATDWLTLNDRYITDHLQGRLTETWLGDDDNTPRLKAVHVAIESLIGDSAARPQPLPTVATQLSGILTRVYERHELTRGHRDDHELIESLTTIGTVLTSLRELDANDAMTPTCSIPEAVAIITTHLAQAGVPDPGGDAAIEMLGYLELALDDAPYLVICGFSEGAIPQSRSADALLPDGLRHTLGIADNQRRYARDAMLLHVILSSRPHVTLVAGRMNAEGDPLMPSRLLLACDAPDMPHRIDLFYPPADAHRGRRVPLFAPGRANRFPIPPPRPPKQPLSQLRVTAFRDYLACPYRFYLRHVAKLEPIDDRAVEMDALTFGNVAHAVLADFAAHEVALSPDAEVAAAFLRDRLMRVANRRFGTQPRVTVVIQLEQLRQRLEAFARWHTHEVRDGWRVLSEHIEQKREAVIDVDGEPFMLVGQIDRIDVHDAYGYRVIDYKTGDTGKQPDKTHRTGPRDNKQWTDLQLPLYRTLAAQAGIDGALQLGYVNLSRDLSGIGFYDAKWSPDELDDALDTARQVVRDIRAGIFWPPAPPPKYEDAYVAVCMDNSPDRYATIAQHRPQTDDDGGDA